MNDAVKPDTSDAAVERDAATVEHFARVWPEDAEESVRDAMRNSLVYISALLRDLLAERDALRAEIAEVLAENDAVRFQLNNALAALREAGHETRAVTPDEQKILHRALRRSVKIVGEG